MGEKMCEISTAKQTLVRGGGKRGFSTCGGVAAPVSNKEVWEKI